MSSTEIYKFKKDGNIEMIAEIRNSWLGAMSVWNILDKKYLPPFIPEWAKRLGETDKEYYRSSDISNLDALKEVWDLYNGDKISNIDNIVLGATFDEVIVMKKDLPILIEAFEKFEGQTSLKEQANILRKLIDEDNDFLAIAWNQTSVNADAWVSFESIGIDEFDEGEYLPYNILTMDKHWNLFDDIELKVNEMTESEYFQSDEFRESFQAQVKKDTWEKGRPMYYLLDGWIVEHWKDGTINKIKESNGPNKEKS